MKPCDCKHLGHCPVFKPDTKRTDLDGKPLWRALTEEERAEQEGQETQAELRAIDPDHVVAYAVTKVGRRCKAKTSVLWRCRNKAP